jgi:WD40 repeat protein
MGQDVFGHGVYPWSIVRVLDRSGEVVGAGFLVAPDIVATCAHVVATALDADHHDELPPPTAVVLDFPLVGRDGAAVPRTVRAVVRRWSPVRLDATGDVALLQLSSAAPPPARLPPLRRADSPWGHEFRVFGFPVGAPDGVWATGHVRDRQGTGWLQLQGSSTDQGIDEGYSGSPVWDSTVGAVIGMTVARDSDRSTTTAYVIPIEQVLGLDPNLLPCPYRGLASFGEEHADVFHGRGEDVERLVAAVRGHAVVAVAGRSGVGKSSLIRAGLLPVARTEGALVVEYRTSPTLSPALSLATVLIDVLDPDGAMSGPARRQAAAKLAEQLSPTDSVLTGTLAEELLTSAGRSILVVLDQFEELLATDFEQARVLLTIVAGLVTTEPPPALRIRAVVTVRWESLGRLLTPELAAVLRHSTVFVTEMSRTQLREAIVNPAERAPGLNFDHGLVDRILDDAGTEPGRLPLVELLLTQLWQRRVSGSLTAHDYDALGGVSGSLVALAEKAIAGFGAADELDVVRRLLTQLAVPARDNDGFARRPVALDALEPELRPIADRLAESRLIVLGTAPDGTNTVELAHQALIEHWPRLRGWLTEDRDFLAWRHILQERYRQWESAERDSGALLRGVALATAADWLGTRESDVPERTRHYINASLHRQRRDVRRWRVVTSVLAVLVIAAGTLSAAVIDRGNQIQRQLDVSNASLLGQQAEQRAQGDPATATQLALAAYRSDPTNLTALTALDRQYLAMRSVDAVFPAIVSGSITSMTSSDDGRTEVFATRGGPLVVSTGLLGTKPHPVLWKVPGVPASVTVHLSGDGRWLAGITQGNEVLLWDLARHSDPTVLRKPDGAEDPVGLMRFSSDSMRFAVLLPNTKGAQVSIWSLGRPGSAADHQVGRLPGAVLDLWLTDDPDQVLISYGGPQYFDQDTKPEDRLLAAVSLSSGTALRVLPTDSFAARGGAAVVSCVLSNSGQSPGLGTVTVADAGTGRQLTRFLVNGDCPTEDDLAEGNQNYLVVPQTPDQSADATLVQVTDLTDGRRYDAIVPKGAVGPVNPIDPSTSAVFGGTDGPGMVLAEANSLLRVDHMTEDWFASLAGDPIGDPSSDGRYVVIHPEDPAHDGAGTVVVRDGHSGVRLGQLVLPADGTEYGTAVDDSLLVTSRPPNSDSVRLAFYSLPALTPRGSYTMSLPADASPLPETIADWEGNEVIAVVAGTVAVWNSATYRQVGRAVRLGRTPGWTAFRPGHPGQVVVVTQDGAAELWDGPRGQLLRTLPGQVDTSGGLSTMLAFDRSGSELAALTSRGAVAMWNLDTGRRTRPDIPVPAGSGLLGINADGQLLISAGGSSNYDQYSIVDLTDGQITEPMVLPVLLPVDDQLTGDRRGMRLGGASWIVPFVFPVTASQWVGGLCRSLNRPFTPAELHLLPPGAAQTPPCS